jgi:hypothetical protein
VSPCQLTGASSRVPVNVPVSGGAQ